MFQQLRKFEPEVFGVMIAATVILGIMRLGLFLTAWNKLHEGLTKFIKPPFTDYYLLVLGAIVSSVLLHFRIAYGEEYETFKEFSMQNRPIFECIMYTAFIGSFAWINTRFILAYGSHLLKMIQSKLHYKPTHSAIWALLGFSMGHFGNFIWFYVAQFSAKASLAHNKTYKIDATGANFAGSLAPVILTGIMVASGNLMKYFENR